MKTVITIEHQKQAPSSKDILVSPESFDFMGCRVRVVLIDGLPWFVASDICNSIGLTSPTKAVKSLDEDELKVVDLSTLNSIQGNMNQTLSEMAAQGVRKVNLINESGMYTLVLRCRDAVKEGTIPHKFKRWVTSEVLPAIRKTGSYIPDEVTPVKVITPDQYQNLVNKIARGVDGTLDSHATHLRIIDFLKFNFGLDSLKDLPESELQNALEQVEAAKADNFDIQGLLIEVKKDLVKKHICGNAPMTSQLRRKYRADIVNQFRGESIDWVKLAARQHFEEFSKVYPVRHAAVSKAMHQLVSS